MNEINTYAYFLIVLGGFALVYGFRLGFGSKDKLSDFEYAGLSSFWGVIAFSVFKQQFNGDTEKINKAISDPFSSGAVMFIVFIIVGLISGWCLKRLKERWRKS